MKYSVIKVNDHSRNLNRKFDKNSMFSHPNINCNIIISISQNYYTGGLLWLITSFIGIEIDFRTFLKLDTMNGIDQIQ
jgi:hypothetical protein